MNEKISAAISDFGKAKYIKATEAPAEYSHYDPIPLFRKEFQIDAPIESAQISVQSPGFACFYINGRPITEDVFISPTSNYCKLLWYNTYDVSTLLHPGKNVIGVIAGNGFFNEPFHTPWHFNEAPWRDAPQFLLCLKVNGEETVISDSSFKATREKSPIIYSYLRSGEYMDARKCDDAWMTAEYDDSDWENAIERGAPVTGVLRPIACQPIREAEEIAPIAITETADGYLADFGVTISGYAEVTLKAERGTEIRFYYTEDLDEHQRPKHNHMDSKYFYPDSPFQLNKLIASGGYDTFKPRFTYHGFRYILIEGLTEKPTPSSIRAYFVHQDVARRSSFDSGNEILNFIYSAGIRSTYSNLFWCLTDCPTREKMGWTNDAQATAEQALINFDILPLFTKWFEDIKSNMMEDGSLPGVVPSWGWGLEWGPVCDCLLYELPYRVYLYTGESRLLTEGIPYFERYADFLLQKKAENHEFILGDWLGHISSPRIPKEFIRDFYLIKALNITALAHELACTGNEIRKKQADAVTREFLNTYLSEDGRGTIDEQCALSIMLENGLYRDKQIIAEQLVAAVIRDELTLTCGMVGIQYLYDALSDAGRPDLAYRLMTESEPGYKTWYKNGATTLWERWDGNDRGSHNHHMFSNVLAWFYKSLLGIAPKKTHPGFTEIELRPAFIKEIGFVKGHMQTVRGTLEAAWKYQNGSFLYTVTVPDGIRAYFRGKLLASGQNRFVISEADI